MIQVTARNLNKAFYKLGHIMLSDSKSIISPRGMTTAEITHLMLEIKNPLERFLSIRGRGNNPLQTIYETLWVFAGRNDIEGSLDYYMPRAADFSDDGGKTWRGGYSKRFYENFSGEDQIQSVIDTLKKDIYSRQAVITIWDASVDGPNTITRDRPCTVMLHFLVRDNKLDLMVVMRSNDMWWGFSAINVFEWTFLQEWIADSLGVEVGNYFHVVGSFHIYMDYYDKLLNVLCDDYEFDIYDYGKIIGSIHDKSQMLNPDHFGSDKLRVFCSDITSMIDKVNKDSTQIKDRESLSRYKFYKYSWFSSAYHALQAFAYLKNLYLEDTLRQVSYISCLDMRIACVEYMFRYLKNMRSCGAVDTGFYNLFINEVSQKIDVDCGIKDVEDFIFFQG